MIGGGGVRKQTGGLEKVLKNRNCGPGTNGCLENIRHEYFEEQLRKTD